MNELAQGILVALIPSIIVSVITAYLTVRFSLKQFYSQQWWEKKAEAYSRSLELLYDLYDAYSNELDVFYDGGDSEGIFGYYATERRSASKALRRCIAINAYIISEKTAIPVSTLLDKLECPLVEFEQVDAPVGTKDREDTLLEGLRLIEEVIPLVREDAKRELHKGAI